MKAYHRMVGLSLRMQTMHRAYDHYKWKVFRRTC